MASDQTFDSISLAQKNTNIEKFASVYISLDVFNKWHHSHQTWLHKIKCVLAHNEVLSYPLPCALNALNKA